MNNDRTLNSLKNSFFGCINKAVNILLPFLVRTVIIYSLGMDYAGLSNLFSSILQVLNLAELGISSAVVYCMYKPMAEGDNDLLCALLGYMRKLYFVIGLVVAFLGLCLMPFVRYFINGSIPDDINIYILYGIYLIYTIIGYFFYAYKSTLLSAGQKIGIISKINTGIIILQSISQIVVVFILKNYYIFLIILPLFAVVNNFWISYAVDKEFPNIICRNQLPDLLKKDIRVRVKGLFITRICNTTRNAFDSIFISAFLGLKVVGIYGNYYYIMSAIVSVMSVITTSITASVGNSIVAESVEKNYHDMIRLNFLYNWIVGFATCCLLIIYQPFMRLWMGEKGMFSFGVVILICVYFYFLNIGSIRAVYHDAAGLWWEARYRAIFEALLNLVLNYILTKTLGVRGTILGTLITLVIINYLYGTQIVFKYYFVGISSKEYFKHNFFYMLATVLGCAVTLFVSSIVCNLPLVLDIIVKFVICTLIFNTIYFFCFRKSNNFEECKFLMISIKQRISFLNK